MLDGFAQGYVLYEDQWSDQREARIVMPVEVEFRLRIDAIVDTGSPWCVISSETVEYLGLTHQTGNGSIIPLIIRGIRYRGFLQNLTFSLQPNEGDPLDVQALVYVPLVGEGEPILNINFLGLGGFLNRIRFAVDPERNRFYFGLLGNY
jgi:hypothetical protein